MATKLAVYNDALQLVGERKLSAIDEATPARYKVDTAWDSGLLEDTLADTDWSWARVTVEIDYDTAVSVEFGHQYAQELPGDMARISGVYSDEACSAPLEDYHYEDGYIYSEIQTLYLQYVPNSPSLSSWPPSFARHMAGRLAEAIAPDLKNGSRNEELERKVKQRGRKARGDDAMLNPSKKIPAGNWTQSRYRGRSGRRGYNGRP